ncbi:DedA family protein [Stigmatella sp. ncwal1]|uniref:DedA family protein n=1 Tax=Stigmatella ashevillensis TaxID=2995309 RepID=A0ABT5D3C1_9BACT|nr:DedA family protein [Stigmatella ashevillena]MDC0707608.1 DedA family protein [Stigmatella ashevillena]
MQELLTNLLGNTQGFLAYAAVFGILVACGLGVPLPEDISLILGGFLAHKGAASLPVMMAVGFAGILAGDSLIFYAGRRLGANVGRTQGGFFARLITPEKRAKVEGLFAIHGQKIVMIARFMPGVRAVTYFTAGSVGMSYWRFIFWDGLAALLSAPVFVWLGFHFGSELDFVIGKFKEGQYVALAVLAVGGVGFFLWRKRKAKAAALPVPAAPPAVAQNTLVRLSSEGAVSSSSTTPFLDAAEKQAGVLSRAPELQK